MSDDRRNSVWRTADLPFAWCEVAADASPADVCDALSVPRAIARAARLAELEDAFAAALTAVTDRNTAGALRTLEISADGVGFDVTEPPATGATLGIHLVLPAVNQLLLKGRVSHRAELGPNRWRVGAVFVELDDAPARRLTRFAIAR